MKRIKQWVKRYERPLSLVALVAGFVVDNLTLARADLPIVNVALVVYLGVMAFGIFLLSLPGRGKWFLAIKLWLPLVIQFAVGNLFSGFFALYFHGAALLVSWPFLLVLFAIFLGSEFGKKHYERFGVQILILYLGILSFLIFHLPIVLGEMSVRIFLLGGLVSLVIIFAILLVLRLSAPLLIKKTKWQLVGGIVGLLVLVNIFYFTGVLPPIPLLLRDIGVYHEVSRASSGFVARGEKASWSEDWLTSPTIHLTNSEPVYVYSSVFAPGNLSTGIIHNWEYYNESNGNWTSVNKVDLTISGGREAGYRSYSFKTAPTPGWWRVSIETESGQVIGRQKFKVERVSDKSMLESEYEL